MTLALEGLHKRFGARKVLDDVSLDVQPGEIVGLLGPNGAGKTTAFRVLAGLLRADGGRVRLDGRDVTSWPLHRRARLGLGYLPQEPSVFRRLTVQQNLEAIVALRPRPDRTSKTQRVYDALRAFDLADRADQHAARLSGGERRRLELARCWVQSPRWLLLDEPFAGIDPIGVCDLQTHLIGLRSPDRAVLITDHHVRATLPLCDRAYLLHEGRIIEEGPHGELAQSDAARSVYLGADFRLDPARR